MTSAGARTIVSGIELRSRWPGFSAAGPALAWTGAVFAVIGVVLVLPIQLDTRQWQGVSTWLKPWKFNVALAIQTLTMALFAHALAPEARRRVTTRIWVAIAVITATFEAAYITIMVAMNLGSHFNVATPAFSALYAMMGVAAVLLSLSGAPLGVQIARFPGAIEIARVAMGGWRLHSRRAGCFER